MYSAPFVTELTAIAMIFVGLVLISASMQDWRSREVSDTHWILIGTAGLLLTAYTVLASSFKLEYVMMLFGSVLLLFNLLHDKEWKSPFDMIFYLIVAVMFMAPVVMSPQDHTVWMLLAIPVSYLIFVVFYFADVIKGGADVKCLISLAMVSQTYPLIMMFPLIPVPSFGVTLMISFPIAILFHAALFSVIPLVFVIIRNVVRRDMVRSNMFIGYRMPVEEARNAHVWPIQDDVDLTEACDAATSAGEEKIWVTPKIPFIIPITLAFIFVIVIGNLFFLI